MDKQQLQQLQTRQYLENQIQNASPAQQIVMLYDGVIKFTQQAHQAIENGDIEARCNANQRGMEIVAYLLEILDVEKGGELGQRLAKIYSYILQQQLKVDLNNSKEAAQDVLAHIRTLRRAWAELATQGTAPAPQQEGGDAPKAQRPSTSMADGHAVPAGKRSALA